MHYLEKSMHKPWEPQTLRPLPFRIGPHGGRSYWEQTELARRWSHDDAPSTRAHDGTVTTKGHP